MNLFWNFKWFNFFSVLGNGRNPSKNTIKNFRQTYPKLSHFLSHLLSLYPIFLICYLLSHFLTFSLSQIHFVCLHVSSLHSLSLCICYFLHSFSLFICLILTIPFSLYISLSHVVTFSVLLFIVVSFIHSLCLYFSDLSLSSPFSYFLSFFSFLLLSLFLLLTPTFSLSLSCLCRCTKYNAVICTYFFTARQFNLESEREMMKRKGKEI
jgi:hypothetical protein